ncbi:MAG: hypothetical protein P8J18_10405, partial [Halieaceae bacterium]|nr:hypothetical protein [Halieaceae bacterium]
MYTKIRRRKFLSDAATVAGSSLFSSLLGCTYGSLDIPVYEQYTILDEILKQPILRRNLFSSPVIIDSLELLRDRNNCLYRVRSRDGAEGLSIGHSFIAKESYPMVPNLLTQYFVEKDARDLDQLIFNAVELNLKRQGIPLCVHVAGIEFAILDMLGKIANLPAGLLLGDLKNTEAEIYLGHHFVNLRQLDPEDSLDLMMHDVIKTEAKAVKLRAGRG